jgi:hypothetical protein
MPVGISSANPGRDRIDSTIASCRTETTLEDIVLHYDKAAEVSKRLVHNRGVVPKVARRTVRD